jgi:hypothetical protein
MFLNKINEKDIITFEGGIAQLVERLPYKQNVAGSNPSTPNKTFIRTNRLRKHQ